MTTAFSLLAALVVAAHLAFVAFAALGGLLVLKWPRWAWAHVPCVAWAAYVELSGRLCPLTPLENSLRTRAGLDAYSGDFIARYVFPVLYPAGLTREAQIAAGLFVIVVNLAVDRLDPDKTIQAVGIRRVNRKAQQRRELTIWPRTDVSRTEGL